MKVFHSFTSKILAIMLILLLFFCAVNTFAWYRSFTREAIETAQTHLDSLIETLNETFDENLREIDYTTAFISNKVHSSQNNCIVQFLTAQEANVRFLSFQQARNYLFNRCNFKAYISGISIYGFDGRVCTYGITTPYDDVSQTEWFSQIQSGKEDVIYLAPHAYTSKRPSPHSSYVFSIVRPVFNNGTIIGVIKADVKSSLLETIFDIQEMQGYVLYVFDQDTGEAIYVPKKSDNLILDHFQASIPHGHGSYIDKFGDVDCLVVYTTSRTTPWQIVGVVSQNTVISGFLQVRNRMLLLVTICTVLFATIAFVLSYYMTKDLRKLTKAVEKISDETLELEVRISKKDEVGKLYQRISAMLVRLRTLIVNIRKAEEEKRRSEISMLSMQINPHFLYNTLHTIKVLSIMQGVENIQTVTDALSRMIHLNLDIRKLISVAEEENYLLDYLQIQKYRYAGKFSYSISIEDEAKNRFVPKLLVQPIVENALQYGIAKSKKLGILQVLIFLEQEKLHILVRNSGPGFPPELLNNQKYCGGISKHIGLQNITRRLQLLFGDEADIRILSGEQLLTSVELILPELLESEVNLDANINCG